jgi:nicotinamidase-related amidase/catechol 2,3-dioxygenase-like lactoylglutathione lyase family enzyme
VALEDLDLKRSALVVVDMQNAFCHPEGTLGQSGVDTKRLRTVIPRLRELILKCRAVEMPVLWTVQEHFQKDHRRSRKKLAPHTARRKGIAALVGTWDANIIEELADLADVPTFIIRKHRFGGFYETRMHIVMEMLGVDHLFIAGLTTNACVETTIREAYLRDYDVIAVTDCISGVNEAWEATAQEVWQQYFAITCSFEEFTDWMDSQQEPTATRLHHLLLMVGDLERSSRFYIDLLGFRERTDAKPLPDGKPFVSTVQGLGLTAGGSGDRRQLHHLAFEVRNVEQLNRKLKDAGVRFVHELGAGPYGRAIYVCDPDGNTLELFESG